MNPMASEILLQNIQVSVPLDQGWQARGHFWILQES
jgi:hypothetical protein